MAKHLGRACTVGRPLHELDTPALVVDLVSLRENIERMAAFFRGRPVSLSPHVKTHKSPIIARMQLEAGASRVTCAKVGEAEVMVDGGIGDVLIANQVVGTQKISRAVALARRARLTVAVDQAANVDELSSHCTAAGVTIGVLVEVDVGMDRCGVKTPQEAVALAQKVAAAPGLTFQGVMGYEGHCVLEPDAGLRRKLALQAMERLLAAREAIERAGIPVPCVSAGGTGTYDITGDLPWVTEIQAGSYVFMDTEYARVVPGFKTALMVLSSVVSRPSPETVVLDAGAKSLSTDYGQPQLLGVPDSAVAYLAEEHGVFRLSGSDDSLPLVPGKKVLVLPGHCCGTVNLHDEFYVVNDGVVVDVWPVAARGRSD